MNTNNENGHDFEAMSGSPLPVGDNSSVSEQFGASLGVSKESDYISVSDGPSVDLTLGVYDGLHPHEALAVVSTSAISEAISASDGPSLPAGFLGAVGAIVTSNALDVSVNQIQTTHGLLPLTGVTGFIVFVNGTRRVVTSAVRLDQVSGYTTTYQTARTIRLTLAYAVQPGDYVEVIYSSSFGNVTDNPNGDGSGTLHGLSAVPRMPVLNEAVYVGGARFDPITFATEADSGANIPASGIYERRLGYPAAVVTLDLTAPKGDVLINDDPASGGVEIHIFSAYDGSGNEVVGNNLVFDPTEIPVRIAGVLGRDTNPSEFEVIGYGAARSMVKQFAPTAGVYPSIAKIVMGAVADTPTGYSLEVKAQPTDPWTILVDSFASPDTLFFPEWDFAAAVPLAAIRLRYRGDYYTVSETGSITVDGMDSVSGCQSIQVSLYPDMRDAGDFPGANAQGWVPFTDGESVLTASLLNTDRIWASLRGLADAELIGVTVLGGRTIVCTPYSVYGYDRSALNKLYTFPEGTTITAITTYNNKIVVGLSNGSVMSSSSGTNFTSLNASTPMSAINCLASFQGALLAGAARDIDGVGRVWRFDGNQWYDSKDFIQAEPSCMNVSFSSLFVGLQGDTGARQGYIYLYDGSQWNLTRDTGADAVDAIGYGGGMLWAGLEGGILHTAILTSTGAVTSWDIPPQTSDANIYYAINDSADGAYVWFCSDTGITAYQTSSSSFLTIPSPRAYTPGLTALFKSASSVPNAKSLTTDSVTSLSFVDANLNDMGLLANVYAQTGNNALASATAWFATYSGFIRADATELHTFYLTSSTPVQLSIGGIVVAASWNSAASPSVQGNVNLIAGQWTTFELQLYGSGEQGVNVEWSSNSRKRETVQPYSITPDRTVFTTAVAHQSTDLGAYAFLLSNGMMQTLDTSTLTSSIRSVYVRFQDNAGNITPLTMIPYDFIVKQKPTRTGITGNPLQSIGKIYQVSTENKSVLDTFVGNIQGSIMAPSREVRSTAEYESMPYFVETLTRWDTISFLALIPSAPTSSPGGLDSGAGVNLYVKTADTKADLSTTDYGVPLTKSSISPSSDAGSSVVGSLDISGYAGKFIQFKAELVSATKNLTPVLYSVTISYKAAAGSYYFSQSFNTSNETNAVPSPTYNRLIFTSNEMNNGGEIFYGYTLSTDPNAQFDFSSYEIITPNTVVELPRGSSQIRFGILLVSVSDSNPAVVDEWAVQFDVGKADLKYMNV